MNPGSERVSAFDGMASKSLESLRKIYGHFFEANDLDQSFSSNSSVGPFRILESKFQRGLFYISTRFRI